MARHRQQPTPLLPDDRGVYILWLELVRPELLQVGRLGRLSLLPGVYAYCGSAQRRLTARVARHHRAFKRFRWHIDYLRVRCRHIGTMVFPMDKEGECLLAEALTKHASMHRPFKGFGASDCLCFGHLAYARFMGEAQWDAVRENLLVPLTGREIPGGPYRKWIGASGKRLPRRTSAREPELAE